MDIKQSKNGFGIIGNDLKLNQAINVALQVAVIIPVHPSSNPFNNFDSEPGINEKFSNFKFSNKLYSNVEKLSCSSSSSS